MVLPIIRRMQGIDWHELDLDALASELRSTLPPAEAEKMVWAFEQAVGVARIDGDLLRYVLAATAALIARAEDSSPRTVFEAFFRRSVSDDEWRDRYAGLIA
jgi:hypothetical protein